MGDPPVFFKLVLKVGRILLTTVGIGNPQIRPTGIVPRIKGASSWHGTSPGFWPWIVPLFPIMLCTHMCRFLQTLSGPGSSVWCFNSWTRDAGEKAWSTGQVCVPPPWGMFWRGPGLLDNGAASPWLVSGLQLRTFVRQSQCSCW